MIKQFYYYLKRNSLEKPISYIIFVTNRCNSRCRHCFNWRNLNQSAVAGELSFQELEKFSDEIGKIHSLGISGGEPFLRDDLSEIILLFSKNNRPAQIDIPTNCLLPGKIASMTESFLKERLPVEYSINLSLDGLKKTHDYIRGVPGNFEKVLETYKALVPLRKKYGLKIKVDTTLMNKNIGEIKRLGFYVKKKMPEVNFHNFEIMRGEPPDKSLHPPNLDELLKLRPIIFELWKGYKFYNSRFKSLIASHLKEHIFNTYLEIIKKKRQVVPCLAYSFNAVLDAKGNVYLCELTPAIGNIRKNTFLEILKSKKAQKMRSFIRKKKCFCTHSCFMQKSIFLNPWHYHQFIINKTLAMTEKL